MSMTMPRMIVMTTATKRMKTMTTRATKNNREDDFQTKVIYFWRYIFFAGILTVRVKLSVSRCPR